MGIHMQKKLTKRRNLQRGGDGNHNIQSVSMPIQYFGGKLPRYFPAGSPQLQTGSGAYGPIVAKSFGTYDPSLTCGGDPSTAPNLSAFPNSSGLQTGGARKKNQNQKEKSK